MFVSPVPTTPEAADPFGLEDESGSLKSFRDGTHRIVSPQETVERMQPLMPVMGITRLAHVTGLDVVGLPVVMAIRPNARSLAVSSGKGLRPDAATASALMEAIEQYHAERIHLPLRLATYNELRYSCRVVDVERVPRLSVSRFHGNLPMLWIEGWDLLASDRCWVPFELVHTNFTLPLPTGSGCFPMTSNGLASGNHILEAIGHGICEVVERDATTLARLNVPRSPARRIDLSTIEAAGCREALQRYDRAQVAVGVWDITSDIGVPTFECVIVDRDPLAGRWVYATSGVGSHPSRDVALLRALTEAAQGRLIYISGSRDDRSRQAYESARDPQFTRDVRARIDRQPHDGDFRTSMNSEHASFAQEVRWLISRLAAVGIDQAIVVDLTKAEFGVPVVRVVIPGLEGISDTPGYVPGARARAVA